MRNDLDARTCPRCNIQMGRGIGINPTDPDFLRRGLGGPTVLITHKDLRLDEVWKCSGCGHSEDLHKYHWR